VRGQESQSKEFAVSILPDAPASFEQSQAVAIRLGDAYPQARFCTFTLDNNKKIPHKRDGSKGVARDTPDEALYAAEDVWAMEAIPGHYLGLVLQKAAAIPGKGHLVVLDVDMKHSQTTTNIAIKKMAEWVKTNNVLTEISVSGKGRHIFLIAKKATSIQPKYKLAAGQEVEVFGLENSAGKSVLLSGSQLTGELIEVDDLDDLFASWGIAPLPAPQTPPAPAIVHPPANPSDDLQKAFTALQFVSPDCEYQTWIEIGQALHTAFGATGYELWNSWSSRGSKYKGERDIDSHWKSFHQGKGVTLGTLFHLAKENGYQPATKTTERKTAVEDFQNLITRSGLPDEPAPLGWHERQLQIGTIRPIRYMIQGFWAHSFSVIAGQPGIGKTTAIMSLAIVMAGIAYRDCALIATRRRKTIIVSEDADQIERTLTGYSRHYGIDPNELSQWFVVIDAKRSSVKDLLTLAHNVIAHTVDGVRPLLVLDTANATMDIENENDNSEVGAYIAAIKQTIYIQLDTPVCIITHTNKQISKSDSDAMARGASAFTGDATLTGVLFEDESKTRYLRLVKTRYQPTYREIRFDADVFQDMAVDEDGNLQEQTVLLVTPQKSSEDERRQVQEQLINDKRQQQITDAADAACNYIQSLINQHPQVIMRKGPGRPSVPKELASAYKLEWAEVYQAVPQADQSYARKAVGAAIFQRFGVAPSASGWVSLG
jgi:hypothetical protein